MDVEILARAQFALTTAFHYIFPPLSIGLGLILVIMNYRYLRTGDEDAKRLCRFWVNIFALIFGLGVASGIVLEFEFGTNWASYSRYVGDIFGSALAAEGVFAFFLESGFLALLVFGWDRISKGMHFFSTVMVWLGSTFSAVWIIVANSWMQTPAGYRIEGTGLEARARITDFWEMVFNPSSMQRLTHTVSAAWVTGAFLVMSISAYYLLKNRHVEFAKTSMKIGLAVALVGTIGQFVTGHWSIDGVSRNQPAKFAAMLGHAQTGPADVTLLGATDANGAAQGIKLPGAGSWLLTGDATSSFKGLNEFAKEDLPPIAPTFQFYHVMITLGTVMVLITLLGCILAMTGKLWNAKWLLSTMVVSVVLPHIANQAGWFAAEVGRQPWIVYGLLRTSDGLSKAVKAGQVLGSLILFTLVYLLLFALFLYLLDRKIKTGPEEPDPLEDPDLLRLGGRYFENVPEAKA